jgi:hypothetical protein
MKRLVMKIEIIIDTKDGINSSIIKEFKKDRHILIKTKSGQTILAGVIDAHLDSYSPNL